MIGRLIEIGRCCGMDLNVEKTRVMRISRETSPLHSMICQKKLENVEYLKYLGSMITNDARRAHEIKSRTAMTTAAFNRKNTVSPAN
jgi:hypothetical protein